MQLEKIKHWIRQFRRHVKPDTSGRALIRSRSIYILPTKQGLVLACVLLLMLVGSINYANNLGYLVTFLLGGVWLTSILHTWRNLLGLTIAPIQVSSVFVNQEANFKLILGNPTEMSRYGIFITPKAGTGDACDIPNLYSKEMIVRLQASHRGELKLNEVSIHSRYPFGLFHAWTYAQLNMSCLVYPQPADWGEPPSEPKYERSDAGDRGAGTDDFVGLRSYRQGDSPRHIDWKAMARERGLYSKQFGGDRIDQLRLDWDMLTDPDPEIRLSQLCRYILLAHERQQAYGLKLPGISVPPGLDEAHKHNCLSNLARFKTTS